MRLALMSSPTLIHHWLLAQRIASVLVLLTISRRQTAVLRLLMTPLVSSPFAAWISPMTELVPKLVIRLLNCALFLATL